MKKILFILVITFFSFNNMNFKLTYMKTKLIVLFIFFVILSYEITFSQTPKTPFPIIFIHGLKGSDQTWNTIKNYFESNYNWINGGRMDFCLNYDGDLSTSDISNTATINDYHDFFNTIKPGDFYIINFKIDNYGHSDTSQYYTDIESNQSAIVKQGKAVQDAIKHVLETTHKDKVILVGHSMGGLAAREYLQNPNIWQADGQHHVAKLCTIGTPNGGSNASFGTSSIVFDNFGAPDEQSEAVRDLRYSYIYNIFDPITLNNIPINNGQGRYLFGGNESLNWIGSLLSPFYNMDINCNGIIGDQIYGINDTINHFKLPLNISYSSLIGNGSLINGNIINGDNGDYVVDKDRADLNNYPGNIVADTFMLIQNGYLLVWSPWHVHLTEQVSQIMRGLDEPADPSLAYEIKADSTIMGFITYQTNNNPIDIDLFKVTINNNCKLSINVSGNDYTGVTNVALLDNNMNILNSTSSIGNILKTIITPGLYYIRITGTANDDYSTYANPYTLSTMTTPSAYATTKPATNITSTSATLNGNVYPNGLSTIINFYYDTISQYTHNTNTQYSSQNPDSIYLTQSFSTTINNLKPATTYYYRIGATNLEDTVYGNQMSFTTLPDTNTYYINFSSNPGNAGNYALNLSYHYGDTAIIHATANAGYLFSGWTVNGTQVSTDLIYYFVVTGNRTLVAQFIIDTTTVINNTNIVINGDFSDDFNNWEVVNWYGANSQIIIENGNKIAKLHHNSGCDWSAIGQEVRSKLINGNKYQFKCHYKINGGYSYCSNYNGQHFCLLFSFGDNSLVMHSHCISDTCFSGTTQLEGVIDTNWHTAIINFTASNTMPQSDEPMLVVYFDYGCFGDIYVDNISITESQPPCLPSVITTNITSITQNTAICESSIINNGGLPIIASGVCWSTLHNPILAEPITTDGSSYGSFTSNITGLIPNTTYYVRAYATNSLGTAYDNNEISFTTPNLYLGNGLVAYYPFNGNANDESGNGNNGTVHGATLTTDRFGNANSAYSFNGVNNDIDVANSPTTNTDNFSISCWINPSIINQARGTIILMGVDDGIGGSSSLNGVNFCMGVHYAPDNSISACVSDIQWIPSNYLIPTINTWYFVVFLRYNGVYKMYINDTCILNQNGSNPRIPTHLKIGSLTDTCFFDGKIDDIRIYNRALSQNEIDSLYHIGGWPLQQPIQYDVYDIDGNGYNTVQIGTQTWLKQNLKTTHYRNGDVIPIVTDNTAWSNLTTGAYCNYNNDANYATTYGHLYNWYTVNDSSNLCPTGWHVPIDGEWTTLTDYLGGESIAGGKLKETGLNHWNSPNTGATNETGFTALPSGYRYEGGAYGYVGDQSYWWSSTETNSTVAWDRYMYYSYSNVFKGYGDTKYHGFPVRCLKDESQVSTKILNITAMLQEYYSSGTGLMNQTQSIDWNTGNISNNFKANIVDTLAIQLRKTNINDPINPCRIDTAFYGLNINTDGTITPISIPTTITGYHYIVVKHRNSIETWSDSVDFSPAIINYNFNTHISQFALDGGMYIDGTNLAYIWGGDVNQNGNLESEDATSIYAAAISEDETLNNGYVINDVDGNGNIDSQDYGLAYSNALIGANVINPFSYQKKK